VAQHDYIIANQSGAAFRADLNNGLAAIVSQNSGAAQPSTTYAYQWWADTTTGLLKIRNAANSAWITIGTMASTNLGLLSQGGGTLTGAVLADDAGTAALPAIAFDGDPDTGIYRKGANQLGLSTGGSERAFLDSNGVTIQAQGDLRLADSDSSNWVALQAPATVATNLTLTVPAADGTADQSLVTNGSGALSFASRTRMVRGTAVATTSGTSVDFTSIPSWVRRITVLLDSVSASVPTAEVGLRVGDSGGVATTGYNYYSSAVYYADGVLTAATTEYTTYLGPQWGLSDTVRHVTWTLTNISGNVWVVAHNLGAREDTNFFGISTGGGRVALSGTLDRIRVFTTAGTFDAGTANILYEG
jgi:hypothetical protein